MKKSFMQYLAAAVFVAALPVAAQEEVLAPLPLDKGAARIEVIENEDGTRQVIGSDNFPSPKADERAFRQREAVRQQIARGVKGGRTHQVAKGQYVDFPVQRTDRVFVMLVEFGDKAGWITSPASPGLTQTPGPLHNQIAEPDRAINNTTIWQADYNREHYVDMYFNQMVAYYRAQSSGRYTFNGEVANWVKVPFNEARYGNNLTGDASMWTLIADTINLWTAAQVASGKSAAEVAEYLRTFDIYDRYDYDKDGNFDEPDGYIDHFQIVHAGAGEETGGGAQGTDAIWSHRWNAFYNLDVRGVGPAFNRDGGVEFGGGWGSNPTGTTLGSSGGHVRGVTTTSNVATITNAHPAYPTGIFVNDYTVQPENGGLGVFAHEYGHDLGLPDHYDTAGGNNGTGYWTIMSSGSYLGEGGEDVGARPGDFSAWDKLQLGWLTYDQADFGRFSVHRLGPAEFSTKAAQAVVIPLPPNQNFKYDFGAIVAANAAGNAWGSGSGDNYTSSMQRSISVPAGTPTLTMRLSYNIEANWDYAYVSISTNNGASWTNLAAAGITATTNPNGQNLGNGITGSSGVNWRPASFNLTPYAGQTVLLRIRYVTDAYTFGPGLIVDDIRVGEFVDAADASPNGWTLDKFAPVSPGARSITNKTHFYIAEFRQYKGYDTGLQTGPYAGTSYLNGKVGHYPYQDGLLITYADYDWSRNNTSVTPGEGFALPIDARPAPITRLATQEPGTDRYWNFSAWTPAVQVYDATFGLDATDQMRMPFAGTLPPLPGSPAGTPNRRVQFELEFPSKPAEPFFSDLASYWSAELPSSSVILPTTGTALRVISQSAHDSFMHIHVNPSNN